MANKLAYSDRDYYRNKFEAIPSTVLGAMVDAERYYQQTRDLEKRITAAAQGDELTIASLTKQHAMAEERYYAELTEVGVRTMEWVDTLAERAGVTLDEALDMSRAGEL